MSGRGKKSGKSYGELLESRQNLRAEILSRIRVASYVVDEEEVSGLTVSWGFVTLVAYRDRQA